MDAAGRMTSLTALLSQSPINRGGANESVYCALRDVADLEQSSRRLSWRPSRSSNHAAENRALVALAQDMAASPDGILQKLAESALALNLDRRDGNEK